MHFSGLTTPRILRRGQLRQAGTEAALNRRKGLWSQSCEDFFWVQAAPPFLTQPLVSCSIYTEQHLGTLARPYHAGQALEVPGKDEKTAHLFFIISHPNKIFISRNKSLKKREKSVSIAFLWQSNPRNHRALAALGSAATRANQARGHQQVPGRLVPSYNCLGPGEPAFMRLGAGHTRAVAVFLGARLDSAGPGVGEGRVTLDWRWACHTEMGTEVWK